MLVFFHIEKAAGSSIRDMCFNYYGRSNCESLYGVDSKSTSANMREIAYPNGAKDAVPLERAKRVAAFLRQNQPAFFSSHMIRPLRPRLGPHAKTLASFREPIARVISNYNHWKQRGLIDCSFEEYYEDPLNCNYQSKRISLEDMNSLDFIAIAEDIPKSVALLNARLNATFKPRHNNKTPRAKSEIRVEELDEGTRDRLAKRNSRDTELYAAVRERFEKECREYL